MKNLGLRNDWCKIVWDNYNIPKHSFFTWLTVLQRLQACDRLYNIGICPTNFL